LLAGFIPSDSVSLLKDPFQLFLAPVDLGQIVVSQLSPLLLDGAFHLLPIPFHSVPVHGDLLHVTDKRRKGRFCSGTGGAARGAIEW